MITDGITDDVSLRVMIIRVIGPPPGMIMIIMIMFKCRLIVARDRDGHRIASGSSHGHWHAAGPG